MNLFMRTEWLLAGALVIGGCGAADGRVGSTAAPLDSDGGADADGQADATADAVTASDAAGDAAGDADAADAAPAHAPIVVVTISGFTFSPVTIARGTTVRWVNASRAPHTVTSGASSDPSDNPGALFDKTLPRGQSFEFTFADAGEQPYFCRFHEGSGMTGVVTVLP